MEAIETFEHEGLTVKLFVDEDPQNPRTDWDNFGHMACWHKRYDLGDEQHKEPPTEFLTTLARDACPRLMEIEENWQDESFNKLCEQMGGYENADRALSLHLKELYDTVLKKYHVILPLYLYDHSGITISVTPFSCLWDSGQVGWIYVSLAEARKEFPELNDSDLRKKAEEILKGEVETYDTYLTGQFYGYDITNDEGDILDSLWGIFGFEDAKKEAESAAKTCAAPASP